MFDESKTNSTSSGLWEESVSAENRAREARWAYIASPEFAKDVESLFNRATGQAIEEQNQAASATRWVK